MVSIIWSDRQPPLLGAQVIISPRSPSQCCLSHMETMGNPHYDARWAWQVKRCGVCGFTVRKIVQELADPMLYADLRNDLNGAHMTRGPY